MKNALNEAGKAAFNFIAAGAISWDSLLEVQRDTWREAARRAIFAYGANQVQPKNNETDSRERAKA